MSEREYIVSLKKGVDYDQFWDQIENSSTDDGFVPERRVEIVNNRDGSLRSCHYALTDSEADILRNDPRVYSVEIPPDQRTDITIGHDAIQSGDFTKTTSDSGSFINWGLRRCVFETNPYDGSAQNQYPYNLDGTGVDVVIQDSGIQADHPDFNDANGVSRVQLIDWYTASGLPGTQNVNHYRDFDGHGTHCAGIAAGKTYGWAKNARIYSVKVNGLEGSGDEDTGISISDVFDVIKLWHRNKPIDPATGYKRPTIVNMSWGYGGNRTSAFYGTYRGVSWSFNDGEINSNNTTLWNLKGIVPGSIFGRRIPVRVGSVDADLQELIDEGVHVCIAAGNSFYKIDVPGGLDYDNNAYFGVYTTDFVLEYYHRGSSPYDNEAFIVGNIDSSTYSSSLEQKAGSSCAGSGVDIYAPGTDIMSCTSTTNRFVDGAYPQNANFRICNISGTSMASPQVCGVGALILQANPSATPQELKNFILAKSKNGVMYTGVGDATYNDQRSIYGGTEKFLFNPFNSSTVLSIT
jgi:subtilisin family serine protease